jgi:pimeloyl-ACP methyl ester carboxylesterase
MVSIASNQQDTGRLVAVNGAELHVREYGEGHPLVLVQPGLLSGAVYEELAKRLAEHFRVITFDHRGHGQSTDPGGELSYQLLTDDTAGLIRTLELENPFVGGWSDGGEVSLHLELRRPGLARALIAAGTSLQMGGHEPTRAGMRTFFHADAQNEVDIEAFAEANASGFVPFLRQYHPGGEDHWRTVLARSVKMWLTYEGLSPDDRKRIAVPALVAIGDRDESIPVEEGVRLFRALPNAELAIFPASDHMRPVFDPQCLAPVLVDFLNRH